jgi:L-aminopeptidase/D-esterase-like protein
MEGLLVGHVEDPRALTGCTVILLPPGSRGGGEVRGGAPGTRETDLLDPLNLVEEVHAFLLAGGSAFGLAAADGVMRFLEERGVGFETPGGKVPIVPAAVIYDLGVGDPEVRPDADMGYRACLEAGPDFDKQGNVGAGMGATVGMIMGTSLCCKGGLGSSCFRGPGGLEIQVLAVVNAFGDVVDERGKILAGARKAEGGFLDTSSCLEEALKGAAPGTNTTVAVVVTNARLSKVEVNWLARAGHHGLARAVRPSHTRFDGDTVFAAACGEVAAPVDAVAALTVELSARAVRNAVLHARSVAGIPCGREVSGGG